MKKRLAEAEEERRDAIKERDDAVAKLKKQDEAWATEVTKWKAEV